MPDTSPTIAAAPKPCARCGGDSDFEIASLWLCINCYHVAGSTCAGIGRMPATATGPSGTPVVATGDVDPADQVC